MSVIEQSSQTEWLRSADVVEHRNYRLHWGRIARLLVAFCPLLGFPLAFYLMGKLQTGIAVFFGGVAVAMASAILVTALRFKVTITAEELIFRGRVKTRRVRFDEIEGIEVRKGRDKAVRFMGPPPFVELVIHASGRRLVISSLPLGEDAFSELLTILGEKLPDDMMDPAATAQ